MRRALGDGVHLMLRPHYLDSFKLTDRYAPFATDVSRHHDVTELMLLADVLVTDYSSVMFDFANTGKPMVFYTYDYEDYVRDERGTYLELPEVSTGPMVATTDELIKALESVDDDVERFRDEYAGSANGSAATSPGMPPRTSCRSSSPTGPSHDRRRAATGRVPGGQQP